MTPIATYRLQFRNGMTFDRAAELVPYLKRLGVSHLYASPIFAATAGSTHGYDIVDHNALDPALGGRDGFERMSRALREAGLGLVLDIVPNHMAASLENPWWRSVVQWGEQSRFAGHFDIDWRERLTLPILGRPFEEAVAEGEIGLALDAERGALALSYFDQRFPLHPSAYVTVLESVADPLATRIGDIARSASPEAEDAFAAGMRKLLSGDGARRLRGRLDELAREPGLLELVHAGQPWRLIFWKDAPRHLSYRRFFEVTGLVGVRVEEPTVFDEVHRLILDLVREGHADGLRIDHVDGLADPKAYLDRLRQEVGPDIYLVVEKIVEAGETLPADWPVAGTTGYEFIAALADALVDPGGLSELHRSYAELRARPLDPEKEKREAKRLMVRRNFAGERSTLVRLAAEIAAEGGAEAMSIEAIDAAIVEIAAVFPVYRTYADAEGLPEADRSLLAHVEEAARGRNRADPGALDFILALLRCDGPHAEGEAAQAFRTRFQQLSGPVMAKAVEDTVFYRFNPLIALNEVGGDPAGEAGSLERFHDAMTERARLQPQGLSATATHDTKRGEDARARLYGLSEAPDIWSAGVARWRSMNEDAVTRMPDGRAAPEAETEWLFYQALAGVWPDEAILDDAGALEALAARFLDYVEKALREAKRRTDWINVDEPYEAAAKAFAARLLHPGNRTFLGDFAATLQPVVAAGRLNSLTQTLVKMAAPGIPDIYQGAERVDLSLVDPDNRRPVDFAGLAATLDQGRDVPPSREDLAGGSFKQRLIAACLEARRSHPDLFSGGAYAPLAVGGALRDHVVAFMRRREGMAAIAVAPRQTLGLLGENGFLVEAGRWQDAWIELPGHLADRMFEDVVTGRRVAAEPRLRVRALLDISPVALLVTRPRDAGS